MLTSNADDSAQPSNTNLPPYPISNLSGGPPDIPQEDAAASTPVEDARGASHEDAENSLAWTIWSAVKELIKAIKESSDKVPILRAVTGAVVAVLDKVDVRLS